MRDRIKGFEKMAFLFRNEGGAKAKVYTANAKCNQHGSHVMKEEAKETQILKRHLQTQAYTINYGTSI